MDLKCSIIHKHFFFFFFFAFVLVPIPKYSATENLLKVWKGQKSLLFSGNCPFSHRTQGARRNGGAVFEDPFQCVTCGTTGGGGVLRRCEGGLLWSWLGVTMGFLSWEVCTLIPSKLPATISLFEHSDDSGWHPSDRKWLSRGENGSSLLPTSIFPHLPLLPSPARERRQGCLRSEGGFLSQIATCLTCQTAKEKLISDMYKQRRVINPLRQAALQLGNLHTRWNAKCGEQLFKAYLFLKKKVQALWSVTWDWRMQAYTTTMGHQSQSNSSDIFSLLRNNASALRRLRKCLFKALV